MASRVSTYRMLTHEREPLVADDGVDDERIASGSRDGVRVVGLVILGGAEDDCTRRIASRLECVCVC